MSHQFDGATPIVISMDTVPPLAPCCQRTAERNYRRGYYDGWKYALHSLGGFLPIALRTRVARFLTIRLAAWKRQASKGEVTTRDLPPAFDAPVACAVVRKC